ncbi:MAG: ABC transporter ATP-binding protein [Bilifractor sp.]|nr:ABC transporter ATP-binding protein [Bilifractor sp.]
MKSQSENRGEQKMAMTKETITSERMTAETMSSALTAENLHMKYKSFVLDIPELRIPKGFVTALIGENGAGKTTLLRILAGVVLNYHGKISYFDERISMDDTNVRSRIGYTAPGSYFLPNWTGENVRDISPTLYPGFDVSRFDEFIREMAMEGYHNKAVDMSDGNRMKLELASVLARNTDLLLLDELASPLDPLMREKLCDLLRAYIADGSGEKTVLLSSHNVADMESTTDYCIFMAQGRIVEQGFVEDLKEKYVLLTGPAVCMEKLRDMFVSCTGGTNEYTALAERAKLTEIRSAAATTAAMMVSYLSPESEAASQNQVPSPEPPFEGTEPAGSVKNIQADDAIVAERPTLQQISVGILRKYSKIS